MKKVRATITLSVRVTDGNAVTLALNALHRSLKLVSNRDREDNGLIGFEIESFAEVDH